MRKKLDWHKMTQKERRQYVNQDFVKKHRLEVYIDPSLIDAMHDSKESVWQHVTMSSPDRLKHLIIQLHNDGKSMNDLLYLLPCSRAYIYKVLNQS